jgi:hypothetical protein
MAAYVSTLRRSGLTFPTLAGSGFASDIDAGILDRHHRSSTNGSDKQAPGPGGIQFVEPRLDVGDARVQAEVTRRRCAGYARSA